MLVCPLERRRQPGAAVEVRVIAAAFLPRARGSGEVSMETATLGVIFEPPAESRPLAEQRLVRDLDDGVGHRQ